MKQTKYFETLADFNVYYPNGVVPSKVLAVVGNYEKVYTSTNNIGGELVNVDMLDGIVPSGELNITENGEDIDVTSYAYVNVDVPTGPNIAANIAAWQEKWGPYLKQVSETIYEQTTEEDQLDLPAPALTQNSQWTLTNILNGTATICDLFSFWFLMTYVYCEFGAIWEELIPEEGITISDSDKLLPYSAEEYFVVDYNSLDANNDFIVCKRSSNLYDFTSNYNTNYYYVIAYDGSSFSLKGGASTDVGGVSGIEFTSPYQVDYTAQTAKIVDDIDAGIITEGIFGYEISASDWYNNYIEPYFLNSISSGSSEEGGESGGGSSESGGDSTDYSSQYLTFEAIEDSTFTFYGNALQYSVDNGSTWTTLAASTDSPTVSAGNKIMWKQTGLTTSQYNGIGQFSATGKFNAYGNTMSVLFGDDFENQVDLTGIDYAFVHLFKDNTNLISAEHLILPATTLSQWCYRDMFNGCTSLTTAPIILPATTLTACCYLQMFQGCTSLTTAPELPATTLADSCYYYMLQGCTSLNYIKCLATDISASSCTSNWLKNVSASGTFVKAASMSDWTTGVSGIPSGWTVEDAA